ncbi:DUF7289 family protein [Halomicrobium salinisoli]|uniref:DUF7289 family protein n=1 Tax=Halomicrobium salinisoli TaxID=2878391 RepID=UPI001CF067C3|nr:hypothetical protein [Halomicrobium salinisoli]
MILDEGRGGDGRAQSEPLGVLLVLSMVLAGTALLVTVGGSAVLDTRQSMDVERAEKGLTQFDSQTALVALGNSRQTRVPLSRAGGASYRVHDDAGRMNVSVTNESTGDTTTIMDVTLGAVTYDDGERTIAYQGGGVWRGEPNGSRMISPPEFHYRDATLTLPLVTVSGDPSLDGQAVVRTDGSSTRYFPDRAADRTNPLKEGRINVTVNSRYYRAWGSYFDERTDGEVHYNHTGDAVRVELIVPINETYENAVATTSEAGVTVNGNHDPPEPYEEGMNYPTIDSRIEDAIADCETDDDCANVTEGDAVTNTSTFYHDGDFVGDLTIEDPGGNVTILVNGTFEPTNVTVRGVEDNDSVSVYVRSDFVVDGGEEVNVVEGDAGDVETVVHSDGDVDFNGEAEYVGLIYAPGSNCDLNGNANLTGGAVCQTMDINGNPNEFSYDEAIEDTSLGLNGDDVIYLTYLHVSENPVEVTDG